MDNDSMRTDGAPARGRWVTRVQIGLLAVTAVLCGFVGMAFGPLGRTTAQAPGGFRGQGGPGGRGGFGGRRQQQERKVLAQFDKDKNKRLDLAERTAARAWLATQPERRVRAGGAAAADAAALPLRRRGRSSLHRASGRTPAASHSTIPTRLRTIFLQFEEPDWEQALADFNNTDVDVPRDGNRRRQDLQGRGRALPRHVLLLHGAGRPEALAQSVVRPGASRTRC